VTNELRPCPTAGKIRISVDTHQGRSERGDMGECPPSWIKKISPWITDRGDTGEGLRLPSPDLTPRRSGASRLARDLRSLHRRVSPLIKMLATRLTLTDIITC